MFSTALDILFFDFQCTSVCDDGYVKWGWLWKCRRI